VTRALLCFFAAAISCCASDGQDALGQSGNTVVAEIDGTRLTLAEFESKRPSALFQARNNFFEIEKKAIQAYIDDFLLERQAKKENVTVAELLERHVNSAIAKDPDDTALRVYYEGLDSKEPFEAVRDKIIEHIRDGRRAKAKAAYMQSIVGQAKISIELEPPRIETSHKNTPVRGPADAPLMLVEFADYECPFCQHVQPTLDRLEADFKGRMAFVYKDMPLPMHPHAAKAAEASRCAELQGKYWEYHDVLSKSKSFEIPQLKATASQLGLQSAAFDKCLDSGEQADAVKANLEEAQKLELQGTPSFFLNGRFFTGDLSYDQLHQILQDELKHSTVQPHAGQAVTTK
jgi:protein-disulfide isomerase